MRFSGRAYGLGAAQRLRISGRERTHQLNEAAPLNLRATCRSIANVLLAVRCMRWLGAALPGLRDVRNKVKNLPVERRKEPIG